jgi:hypothetical protein
MYYNKKKFNLNNLFYGGFFLVSLTFSSSCIKSGSSINYNKNQILVNYKQVLIKVIEDLNKIDPEISKKSGIISQILLENQAKEIISPLLLISKGLLKTYILYDSLNLEIDGNEKGLIIAAILVFNNEIKSNTQTTAIENKFRIMGERSILAIEIDRQELNGCLLEIFGLGAGVYGLIKVEGKIIVKNLVSLVMKVGLKSLSWVGIAYTVYNLTMCLVEADND